MKYSNIEGLEKKDPFKKGFIDLLEPTMGNLLKNRVKIIPESLGEPATLLDFLDYDFLLAFKTDGVGTKSLIADKMSEDITKKGISKISIAKLYSGLGVDVIASNVNDLICLGATPIALSDEIAVGNYKKFTNKKFIRGLYQGFKKGCQEAGIAIPCGESPTQVDIVAKKAINITGSSIGIVRPKNRAILGQKLKAGDVIFALSSNGIHTNGLSLARKIVEKLPHGYFTKFGRKTIGEELLTPTKIYVKPILEMINKGTKIHYMSHISGGAFRKIKRSKNNYTYIIKKSPKKPKVLEYLQKLSNMPNYEAYETWNMGIGYVIFAPSSEEKKMSKICKKYKLKLYRLGKVQKGPKKVIIEPLNIVY